MISSEVINAMVDLIDENIRLIEEIRSQGYESFSNSFRDIQAAKHALQESIEVQNSRKWRNSEIYLSINMAK